MTRAIVGGTAFTVLLTACSAKQPEVPGQEHWQRVSVSDFLGACDSKIFRRGEKARLEIRGYAGYGIGSSYADASGLAPSGTRADPHEIDGLHAHSLAWYWGESGKQGPVIGGFVQGSNEPVVLTSPASDLRLCMKVVDTDYRDNNYMEENPLRYQVTKP